MKTDESLTRKERLLLATRSGNYPAGTTAEELAMVILDRELTAYLRTLDFRKVGLGQTALHVAARERHLPPGTTPQVLINAKDYDGFTALHLAAEAGVLPPETTVAQLIETRGCGGFSALHFVPATGPYFKGVTQTDLMNTKTDWGWSALHASANAANLLEGTTIHDLWGCKDDSGRSALADLPKEFGYCQIKPVLDATTVSSIDELKQLGRLIWSRNPAAVAAWMSTELLRLQKLNRV